MYQMLTLLIVFLQMLHLKHHLIEPIRKSTEERMTIGSDLKKINIDTTKPKNNLETVIKFGRFFIILIIFYSIEFLKP